MISVVPANQASWEDLQAIFGTRGPAHTCQCQRGISRALAGAAVGFARERGARALEAYPMTTKDVLLEELHPGTAATFAAAGLAEVSRPTIRRAVMRIDF